jgi:hypothetical protein
MPTQKLLETLEQLPDIALANCAKAVPSVESLHLPRDEKYLFGHRVLLDPIQSAHLELSTKQQIIQDWQTAAKDVKQLFAEKGFTSPLVVPMSTFVAVCDTCKLNRFEDITNEGCTFLNPFAIDYFLSRSLFVDFDDLGEFFWLNSSNSTRKRSDYSKWLEIPIPLNGRKKKISFIINDISAIEYFLHLKQKPSDNWSLETKRGELLKTIQLLSDPYSLCNMMQRVDIVKSNSTLFDRNVYQGNIVFPDVPSEIQKMLYNLKWKFPHFPVCTAADPAFFKLSYAGLDMNAYTKDRCEFWLNMFDSMVGKIGEYEKINELLQKEFSGILNTLKVAKKHEYFFMSREDMLKAIDIEKDPIFYLPVEKLHKHVKYKFAVVYAQCGTSPNEQDAIDMLLKQTDHQVFFGVAAN